MTQTTLADALEQALDTTVMRMVAARFHVCMDEGRDYFDGVDLQAIDEYLRDDLRTWRPLAGGTLHDRIVAACRQLNISTRT